MKSIATAIDRSKLLPATLRDDFPILQQTVHGDQPLVFLDNAASTQRPRQVIDVLRRVYERDYANVHRGIHTLSERSTEQYEEAREKVRAFIGAEHAREIIFTSGTTAGINLVARSWGDANVQAGDEILSPRWSTTRTSCPGSSWPSGPAPCCEHIPITDDGLLDPRRARHAAHRPHEDRRRRLGLERAGHDQSDRRDRPPGPRGRGAACWSTRPKACRTCRPTCRDLGADFLAFSGHKMLGPTGIGVLYGREELLDAMPPFLGGGSMINRVWPDRFTPAELPAKFEAGTPPIAPAIALGAAIDYLNAHRPRRSRTATSTSWPATPTSGCKKSTASTSSARRPSTAPASSASRSTQPHAHDVAQLLDQQGIAVRAGHHCTQPLHDRLGITASTRASFYLYNTPAEVDLLVDVVRQIRDRFRPQGRNAQAT